MHLNDAATVSQFTLLSHTVRYRGKPSRKYEPELEADEQHR